MGKRVVEQVLEIAGNVDRLTCTEMFKGDFNDQGKCVVKIEMDSDKPDEAKLKRTRYLGPGQKQAPGTMP